MRLINDNKALWDRLLQNHFCQEHMKTRPATDQTTLDGFKWYMRVCQIFNRPPAYRAFRTDASRCSKTSSTSPNYPHTKHIVVSRQRTQRTSEYRWIGLENAPSTRKIFSRCAPPRRRMVLASRSLLSLQPLKPGLCNSTLPYSSTPRTRKTG